MLPFALPLVLEVHVQGESRTSFLTFQKAPNTNVFQKTNDLGMIKKLFSALCVSQLKNQDLRDKKADKDRSTDNQADKDTFAQHTLGLPQGKWNESRDLSWENHKLQFGLLHLAVGKPSGH